VILLKHCIDGLRAHEKSIREVMQRSLMPVTAPAPKIGYDNAANWRSRRMQAKRR